MIFVDHFKVGLGVFRAPGNRGRRFRALARLCWWFFRKRLSDRPVVLQVFGDRRFVCHRDGLTSNTVMGRGEWCEYDTLHFFDSFLRPTDMFLDVGANIGLFTVMASRIVPGERIFCIEPGRIQRLHLAENLQLNQIAATVFPFAVGDETKAVSFTTGDAIAHVAIAGSEGGESASMRRLDDFVPDRAWFVMKLDVEGFEFPALRGASRLIEAGKLPVIVFEINGASRRYGIHESSLLGFLRSQGYKLGTYSHDSKTLDFSAPPWDDVVAVNATGLQLIRSRMPATQIVERA